MWKKKSIIVYLIVLIFTIIATIISSANTDRTVRQFDAELLEVGTDSIQDWSAIFSFEEDANFSLTLAESYHGYYVNECSNTFVFVPVTNSEESVSFSESNRGLSWSQKTAIRSAYRLISSYVDQSSVLKDKFDLLSYLETIQFQTATFSTSDVYNVYFDEEQKIIFLDENRCPSMILKWKIVREYVRALSLYTHVDSYRYRLFDAMMTDAIAAAILEPDVSAYRYVSYTPRHYEDVYPIIGIFQEKSIEAYFYGYDLLFDQISEIEFHGFIDCIEMLDDPNGALRIYAQLLLKWEHLLS